MSERGAISPERDEIVGERGADHLGLYKSIQKAACHGTFKYRYV